ncbi:MAG: hypothetical protein HUK40_20490 [Desulfobacter sp.]|nr:hypothetical protein [Desulfobacter sp.]
MAGYNSITNAGASTADGYTVVTTADLDTVPAGFTLEYKVTGIDLDTDGTDDVKEINLRVKDNEQKIRSNITFIKSGI